MTAIRRGTPTCGAARPTPRRRVVVAPGRRRSISPGRAGRRRARRGGAARVPGGDDGQRAFMVEEFLDQLAQGRGGAGVTFGCRRARMPRPNHAQARRRQGALPGPHTPLRVTRTTGRPGNSTPLRPDFWTTRTTPGRESNSPAHGPSPSLSRPRTRPRPRPRPCPVLVRSCRFCPHSPHRPTGEARPCPPLPTTTTDESPKPVAPAPTRKAALRP